MRKMFSKKQIEEMSSQKAKEIIKSGSWLEPIRIIPTEELEDELVITMKIGERILLTGLADNQNGVTIISPVVSSMVIPAMVGLNPTDIIGGLNVGAGYPANISLVVGADINEVSVTCDLFGNLIVSTDNEI